jgi:hypothetical protein
MRGLELQNTLQGLEQVFTKFGINTDSIGFYDSDSFLRAERLSSIFLENYAAFVQMQRYSESYINKATLEIPFIAKILHEELVKDGRLGACIDASIVLSRILEREGFWNFIAKGSLTINFPLIAMLENRYFWSVDFGEFAAAHAWVVAPPFNIIDITIQQQPFFKGEEKWLPPYIFQQNHKACKIQEQDIISPNARQVMKIRGIRGSLLPHTKSNWKEFTKIFQANLIEMNGLTLKYSPVGIAAPDEPLERVGTLNLSGRKGIELYKDLIVPSLKEFRKENS